MRYGTSVSGQDWDDLMEKARKAATLLGVRVKIYAVLESSRGNKISNEKYAYVVSPESAMGKRRCGVKGPNGKPCLLPTGPSDWLGDGFKHLVHVCRGNEEGVLWEWTYCRKRNMTSCQENTGDYIILRASSKDHKNLLEA